MRKLKLAAEDLMVDTFDIVAARDGEGGTVQANSASIDYACTRDESCYWELCQEEPTNDPRLRQCYTPYVQCSTQGWTCDYCGGPISPTRFC